MMNKRTIALFIIAALAMMVIGASNPREPIGDRISVAPGGSIEHPAGEPFHIDHGWITGVKEGAHLDFELYIDNEFRDEDFVIRTVWKNDNNTIGLHTSWLHNFPEGMTDTHTFVGKWYLPCQIAAGWGYEGPCKNKNEKVVVATRSLSVTFTE